MFEIIVKLKNKVAANQPFPDGVTWGIKITRYLSVFINQSVLTRSLTPLAEIQPQTITVPQLCFHKKVLQRRPREIYFHHSPRPLATHFLSMSCVIWHTSPCFTYLKISS